MVRRSDQPVATGVSLLDRTISSQGGFSRPAISDVQPGKAPRDASKSSNPVRRIAKESFYASASKSADAPTASAVRRHVGRERRIYPRRDCRIEAHLKVDGDVTPGPVKVSDISLGGCYLEMLSPLPLDTQIDLTLDLNGVTSYAQGLVRSSQSGMGMGIEFTEMSREDFENLRKFAPPAPNASAPTFLVKAVEKTPSSAEDSERQEKDLGAIAQNPSPATERNGLGSDSSPKPPPIPPSTMAEALEAVVRVLFRRGLITKSEIAEELEKLKSVKK